MKTIEELTKDELARCVKIHIDSMGICNDQMEALFERWKNGNLDRRIYSIRLKSWEDKLFDTIRNLERVREQIDSLSKS